MIAAPIDVPRASGFIPDKLYSSSFMSRIQVRLQKKRSNVRSFCGTLGICERGKHSFKIDIEN